MLISKSQAALAKRRRSPLQLLMTNQEMERTLLRISKDLVESHPNLQDAALVGIRRRGVPLARRLKQNIEVLTGHSLPLGILDINFYRDDLSLVGPQPIVGASQLDFPVTGRTLVLVDDVLYTGRTVRAALESLLDYGRPKRVELVVLVDRGRRELPIQADHVGRRVDTREDQTVDVHIAPVDEDEGVFLTRKGS